MYFFYFRPLWNFGVLPKLLFGRPDRCQISGLRTKEIVPTLRSKSKDRNRCQGLPYTLYIKVWHVSFEVWHRYDKYDRYYIFPIYTYTLSTHPAYRPKNCGTASLKFRNSGCDLPQFRGVWLYLLGKLVAAQQFLILDYARWNWKLQIFPSQTIYWKIWSGTIIGVLFRCLFVRLD